MIVKFNFARPQVEEEYLLIKKVNKIFKLKCKIIYFRIIVLILDPLYDFWENLQLIKKIVLKICIKMRKI